MRPRRGPGAGGPRSSIEPSGVSLRRLSLPGAAPGGPLASRMGGSQTCDRSIDLTRIGRVAVKHRDGIVAQVAQVPGAVFVSDLQTSGPGGPDKRGLGTHGGTDLPSF